MSKRTIAIIPARSGSKAIKNKNIINLGGVPLIAWSIKACQKSKLIDRIIVSTDSKRYANISRKYGVDEVVMRPKKISQDKSIDFEFIFHVIKNIKFDFEFIAHIRPTTPLREKGTIDKAIKIFKKEKYTSLRSVHEISETSYKNFEIKNNSLLPLTFLKKSFEELNNPRQKFPKTYMGNGVIDIYRKSYILNYKKLFGKKVRAFKTPYSPEIDTFDDLKLIKKLI